MTNISPTHARITELIQNGFVLLPSFPDMVLDLRQLDNFESYLATLKAEDRSSVRRNKRVFRERGYTLKRSTTLTITPINSTMLTAPSSSGQR